MAEAGPRLHRLAYLLVGDSAEAQDVVADAIVRCIPRLRRGEVQDAAAYLTRAVVNRGTSRRRRLGLERRHRAAWSGDLRGALPVEDAVASRVTLLAALATLPRRQRAALVLRYYEDLTEAQTAEALGVSVGAVKTHCARGLAALRERLTQTERSRR